MYKIAIPLIFLLSINTVFAFQDCIIESDGKLTDISIENKTIVDVYPIFTIMNERNTLYVHPLKEGKTRICVLKNGKQKIMFNVEITENETKIDDIDGFDVLTIDEPPEVEEIDIDEPPEGLGEEKPLLRGEESP